MTPRSILLLLALTVIGCHKDSQTSSESIAMEYQKVSYDYDYEKMSLLLHRESLHDFREIMSSVAGARDALRPSSDSLSPLDSLSMLIGSMKDATTSDTVFFLRTMEELIPSGLMRRSAVHVTPKVTLLGQVPEGEDTVHVLTRVHVTRDSVPLNDVFMISLKRQGSTWGVMMPASLMNRYKLRAQYRRR